jgi:hypothetical protein
VIDNTNKFKELAAKGDDDFIGLMKEIEERTIFREKL